MPDASYPDHSTDGFLGGRVTLVQPRGGHRAGLDAALLQALVPDGAQGCLIDLGTGSGAVAFSVAARCPGLRVIGVEREAELVAAAQLGLAQPQNAAIRERVRVIQGDVTGRREERTELGLPDGSADWVLMNPPYDDPNTLRPSPDPARRAAHVSLPDTLESWCRSAAGLLRPGGKLGLIHRAAALGDILPALNARFGDAGILPVHPTRSAPATRILVSAVRASRAGPKIIPGLVLHSEDKTWTPLADLVLRGERNLASATENSGICSGQA